MGSGSVQALFLSIKDRIKMGTQGKKDLSKTDGKELYGTSDDSGKALVYTRNDPKQK